MKICSKCGTEFSDDYNFCEKCGAPLTEGSTDKKTDTSEVSHSPIRVEFTTSLSQFVQLIQHYGARIMRVAALFMVVLFFCPLFMVSCDAMQMKVSGFETATGFSFDDDGNTKSNWLLTDEDNSHYYTQDNASLPSGSLIAFGVLVLAGAMLASTFAPSNSAAKMEQGKLRKIQIILAVGHIAWLFYVLKGLEKSAQIEGMEWASTMLVTVEPTGCFRLDIAATILFAAVALVCLIDEDTLKKTMWRDDKFVDDWPVEDEPDVPHDTSADEFFDTDVSDGDLDDAPDVLPDDWKKDSLKEKKDEVRGKADEGSTTKLRINKGHSKGATSEAGVKTSPIKTESKSAHFHKPSSL
mgnify:FL=1